MKISDWTFRDLIDNLPEGVYFVDPDRRIQYWNKAAETISGFSQKQVVGSHCYDNLLVHVDEHGKYLCHDGCPLQQTIEDGKSRNSLVYLHHFNGHRVPVQVQTRAVRDEVGNIIGGVETFVDSTEQLAIFSKINELQNEALIDPLTGIGNRRFTETTLEKSLVDLLDHQTQFSILFIDIDLFKNINDTFGHPTGDQVLKMVSKTLLGSAKAADFIGRWGGEEFIMLLNTPQPLEAQRTANTLRIMVGNSYLIQNGQKIQVTVSIGGTSARPEDTLPTLIERVDQAMYQSKKAGRNRVTWAE